jgi:hypothetical protein
MRKIAEYRALFALVGGVVCLWGILGLTQARNWGRAGYDTRWGAEVVRVEPGGPADAAGLEEGDRIVRVGGAPIENPWLSPSLGRVGVGGVQTLQVKRRGETMVVDVTWGPLAAVQVRALFVDGLVVLSFLGCGLWALLVTGTRAGLLLAVFGLCYGVANFRGPGLGLPDGAVAFVQSNLSLFYTALLCHFLMIFPKPKGVFRRPMAGWILFIPFLVFLIFGFVEWLSFPALLDEYATTAMLTDLLYMLLALTALIHSWISLSRSERRKSGFYWIPLGLAVAIGPFILLGLIGMVVPNFTSPGEKYLPVLGAVIPAGLALAVVTKAHRGHQRSQ